MTKHGAKRDAAPIALRAWRQSRDATNAADSEVVRQALSAVVPRYHTQISSDVTRIATWQAALRDVVKPGMLVLEIGTGSGILSMLAARAGAEVVTCENDVVMANIAKAVIEQNGFTDRIKIIPKPVHQLRLPEHLGRPADVLMLDLFGDQFFNFRPFDVLGAAGRLIQPDAITVPMRVSLQGALAEFRRWNRVVPSTVCQLDISQLRGLSAMEVNLDACDSDLMLRSGPAMMVEASLPHKMPSPSGVATTDLVSRGGSINGIAIWIRWDLAPGHVLEARPGLSTPGFYARPRFIAFPKSFDNSAAGQLYSIRTVWDDVDLNFSLVERR